MATAGLPSHQPWWCSPRPRISSPARRLTTSYSGRGCERELRQRLARMLGSHDVESVYLAASIAPVLLSGETGTGKELCARAIHHLSRREGCPFIPVECGVLPDHLAENEIFRHVRGAFTDAHADQKGLAAMAEGGTLFLDEIDALSLAAQAKLLRFLEDGA